MRIVRLSTACAVLCLATITTACNPAEPAKMAVRDIGEGNKAACVTEKQSIEQAVEAYMLLNSDIPVVEADLVAKGILHEQSKLMDIQPDGVVVPAIGTVCV
jgi:hypothetical protein